MEEVLKNAINNGLSQNQSTPCQISKIYLNFNFNHEIRTPGRRKFR